MRRELERATKPCRELNPKRAAEHGLELEPECATEPGRELNPKRAVESGGELEPNPSPEPGWELELERAAKPGRELKLKRAPSTGREPELELEREAQSGRDGRRSWHRWRSLGGRKSPSGRLRLDWRCSWSWS